MILNDHFLRLIPYVDYRDPADAERYQNQLDALHEQAEEPDLFATAELPALMRRHIA